MKHEITCLAGIDPIDHECTCGNTSVTKPAFQQYTCERCGHKTEAGVWMGGSFYIGLECLDSDDKEMLREQGVEL